MRREKFPAKVYNPRAAVPPRLTRPGAKPQKRSRVCKPEKARACRRRNKPRRAPKSPPGCARLISYESHCLLREEAFCIEDLAPHAARSERGTAKWNTERTYSVSVPHLD